MHSIDAHKASVFGPCDACTPGYCHSSLLSLVAQVQIFLFSWWQYTSPLLFQSLLAQVVSKWCQEKSRLYGNQWQSFSLIIVNLAKQGSYTLAYCVSFYQHSAERIDLMTPFIFNLVMMKKFLIKSLYLAKKELWELANEITVFTIPLQLLTGKAARAFSHVLLHI